jgi:hypothetical protein
MDFTAVPWMALLFFYSYTSRNFSPWGSFGQQILSYHRLEREVPLSQNTCMLPTLAGSTSTSSKEIFLMKESQDLYIRNYKKFEPCHNSHVSVLQFGRYSKVSLPQRVKKAINCHGVYTVQRARTHTQTTRFLSRFMLKR